MTLKCDDKPNLIGRLQYDFIMDNFVVTFLFVCKLMLFIGRYNAVVL